ncbi:MAG: precorrin-6y C5,15-methyltransferase (decarboxylating) subunit CbiE, partial [Nitrospinaceae bacterium]|nr:precorrin-6y C5,15-methyltransferase (decarboxylating) subunit CbiE [Nitrospinaceae bacterium]
MSAKEINTPWLSLVGVGDDGLDGLGQSARDAVAGAEIIIGGQRHLAFLPEESLCEKIPWPSPLQKLIDKIPDYRGKNLCVLATGDPFFFGIGKRLTEKIAIEEMRVYPAPSSFSLALSRLGWPHSDAGVVSLHGRPLRSLLPRLVDKARLVMLTENRNSPGEIAALLAGDGFGDSTLHVFSHIGGPEESHISLSARDLAAAPHSDEIQDLNILAAELRAEGPGLEGHLLPGIEDDRFRHDGQITKLEIRILTLAALMPRPGDLLWDVGAGAGSISIEWLRADPSLEAIAIEKFGKRMDNLLANAEALGTPRLQTFLGDAPSCLALLPDPDAVFIGGGLRDPEMLDTCWARLKSGGRLVANVVTLEGEGALQA